MFKYYTKQICFQEIPDEISLAYYVTNCPRRCRNCHSPHLRDDVGNSILADLEADIKKNKFATCILFMGGDDVNQVEDLLKAIDICNAYHIKTALYSGFDLEQIDSRLIKKLDYLKSGPYIDDLGGLKSKNTNQRLFRIIDGHLLDITHMFWRRLDDN